MVDYLKRNETRISNDASGANDFSSIVLEKDIFNNIFKKDIKWVYIYKKAERIAKAIYLVLPAFKDTRALKDSIERAALSLVDSGALNPAQGKDTLIRALMTLSSVLSLAKTSRTLSPMNADLISEEVRMLLHELALYEQPRMTLPPTESLAVLMRGTILPQAPTKKRTHVPSPRGEFKGQIKDKSSRQKTILDILKTKGPIYIKDISTLIRDVSEKTIQRELQALVLNGLVEKEGERRWTVYKVRG